MTGAVKVFYLYEKGFHLSGKSDQSLRGVLHCISHCLFFKKTFSDFHYRQWQTYRFGRKCVNKYDKIVSSSSMIACMGENGLI